MTQVERYRIVLTGWVMTGYQTQDVIAELSQLFKIPEDRIRPLLVGEPSIIRRDLTQEKAEHLRNKIEKRGAICNIKPVMRDESADHLGRMDSTGILEPGFNLERSQLIPTERSSDVALSKPLLSGRNRVWDRRGSWGVVSVLLLVSVLVTAMASDYFNWPRSGHSSNLDSELLTHSTDKKTGLIDRRLESARD